MANGYIGKMLKVDLSSHELKDEILDEKICRDFIGGYGIAAKIIFNEQAAGVDPLGPDNILGFITGPFTGTPAISAMAMARWTASASARVGRVRA